MVHMVASINWWSRFGCLCNKSPTTLGFMLGLMSERFRVEMIIRDYIGVSTN